MSLRECPMSLRLIVTVAMCLSCVLGACETADSQVDLKAACEDIAEAHCERLYACSSALALVTYGVFGADECGGAAGSFCADAGGEWNCSSARPTRAELETCEQNIAKASCDKLLVTLDGTGALEQGACGDVLDKVYACGE